MAISAASLRLLVVILTGSLLPPTLGDEFTNPSNSNADLTAHYTLGQTVEITWDTSLQYITLLVSHWGQGDTIGSLLCKYSNKTRCSLLNALITSPADALNAGVFVWTIGESDNINEEQIAADPDFVLEIQDPSGQTGTGNGFINGTLQSRGFTITSNVSSSSSSSSLAPITSTSVSPVSSTFVSSSATTTSVPKGTSSPTPASGLSIGAKAGIGVGAGIGGIALIALGVYLGFIFQHRRNKTDKPQVGHSPPMPSQEKEFVNAVKPDIQPSYNQPSELGDNSVYHQPSELGDNSAYHQPSTYHEIGDGRSS